MDKKTKKGCLPRVKPMIYVDKSFHILKEFYSQSLSFHHYMLWVPLPLMLSTNLFLSHLPSNPLNPNLSAHFRNSDLSSGWRQHPLCSPSCGTEGNCLHRHLSPAFLSFTALEPGLRLPFIDREEPKQGQATQVLKGTQPRVHGKQDLVTCY